MLHFFACWTLIYWNLFHAASCCTYFMLHFFRVPLFSCCTFFMLHSFQVVFFPCCIRFMLHLFSCYTVYCSNFFMLLFFPPLLWPVFCFTLFTAFPTLHFFHIALFHVALISCCTFSLTTFLMLYSFHNTLYQSVKIPAKLKLHLIMQLFQSVFKAADLSCTLSTFFYKTFLQQCFSIVDKNDILWSWTNNLMGRESYAQ